MRGKQSKAQKPSVPKDERADQRINVEELHTSAKLSLDAFLSLKEKGMLVNADNKQEELTSNGQFFKPSLDKSKIAYPFLKAVITGNLGANPEEKNPNSLMNLVKNNTKALFTKGDISFPNGCDLYRLPTLPANIAQYKGNYVWIKNQKLIYVHYDGTKEDVHLNNPRAFKNQFQSLPKEWVDSKGVYALSNEQIKAIITDNGGHKPIPHQYFHQVSAFQLMQFFCDEDMIKHIMRLVSPLPEKLGKLMEGQLEALGTGGADIIKVDRAPKDLQFEDLLHYKTSYTVAYGINGTLIKSDVTISLLENPDGLIYYKDSEDKVHLYRACTATRTIEPIDLHPIKISELIPLDEQQSLVEEKRIFDKMMKDIDAMEPMSAKRSSNDEHKVIAKTMRYSNKPVQLHRQGITFDLEGVRFQSNRYDFNRRINAYRKCDRLYSNGHNKDGDKTWCQEVGHTQKEVMWWLQRDCEENRPYYPLPDFKSSPFRRGFNIENWIIGRVVESVFNGARRFVAGFGSIFAIYKAADGRCCAAVGAQWWTVCANALVAGIRLIEDAKANVVELELNRDIAQGPKHSR